MIFVPRTQPKSTELGVGLVRDKAEGIFFLGWSFGCWNPTVLGQQGRAEEAGKLVACGLSQQLGVHTDHGRRLVVQLKPTPWAQAAWLLELQLVHRPLSLAMYPRRDLAWGKVPATSHNS